MVETLVKMTADYQLKKMQTIADGIWPEVVLSDEERSWRKGGDKVNVCSFGGAVGELSKIM